MTILNNIHLPIIQHCNALLLSGSVEKHQRHIDKMSLVIMGLMTIQYLYIWVHDLGPQLCILYMSVSAIQMSTCRVQSLQQLCSQREVHVFCMTRCTQAGATYMQLCCGHILASCFWLLQLLTTRVPVNGKYQRVAVGVRAPSSWNWHPRLLKPVSQTGCLWQIQRNFFKATLRSHTRENWTDQQPQNITWKVTWFEYYLLFFCFSVGGCSFFILTLFHVWVGAPTQRGAVHQHTNRNREVHKGSENWTSVFFSLSLSVSPPLPLLSSSVPKKAGAAPGHELKRDTWRRRGEEDTRGREVNERRGGGHVSPTWRHSPGGYIWSTINLPTIAANRVPYNVLYALYVKQHAQLWVIADNGGRCFTKNRQLIVQDGKMAFQILQYVFRQV